MEYRAFVFALKGGKSFDDCLEAKKLMSYRSVIISEHPPSDEPCEWNGLHYHGLVENNDGFRFDTDRKFNQMKLNCCEWFKSEKCKLPVNYLAYMQVPPRKIIFRAERPGAKLCEIECAVDDDLIQQVAERKQERIQKKLEGVKDIMVLKDMIIKSRCRSEAEMINVFHNDKQFEDLYCKRTFSINFRKALSLANQTVLDMAYLDLTREFDDVNRECMTPYRSADLMMEWFKFQNIDPRQFCLELLDVLDKKQRKLNTFMMLGAPNSGKTFIAKSIEKACQFTGEICQGIAGYNFMWQECINKRCIIMNEPVFDNVMIEKLKIVMEGTGTMVAAKYKDEQYMRPTPVIVTSNNHLWLSAPCAKEALLARCRAVYEDLQAAPMLKHVRKDLHPRWINLILQRTAPNCPTSDISDSEDECHTSQGIDTADQEPTSPSLIEKAGPSTPSTQFAEPTTSILKCPDAPKKLIKNSCPLRQRLEFSETPSQELSQPRLTSNLYLEDGSYLGTPKRTSYEVASDSELQTKRPRLVTVHQKLPNSPGKRDQARFGEISEWETSPQTKRCRRSPPLRLQEDMEEESAEEEDKSPNRFSEI